MLIPNIFDNASHVSRPLGRQQRDDGINPDLQRIYILYLDWQWVKAQDNYLLDLLFDNGVKGILDMKPYLEFGVLKNIKDKEKFKQVKISFDTIEWQDGIDLDPEFIYNQPKLT